MKKIFLSFYFLVAVFFSGSVFSYGTNSHIVIMQIALNHVSPEIRDYVLKKVNILNHTGCHLPDNLSAIWLDNLRQIEFFNTYHFQLDNIYNPQNIDVSFFKRINRERAGIAVVLPYTMKALSQDFESLSGFEQSYLLRLLIHLVGDAHQPLHMLQTFYKPYVNEQRRSGSTLSGNRILIQFDSSEARLNHLRNLHRLWDRAGSRFAYDSSRAKPGQFPNCPQSAVDYIHRGALFIKSGDYLSYAKDLPLKYDVSDVDLTLDNFSQINLDMKNLAIQAGYQPLEQQIIALKNPEDQITLSKEYVDSVTDITGRNLVIAGLRLADFLRKNIHPPQSKNPFIVFIDWIKNFFKKGLK